MANPISWLAIGLGAALGAWCRWLLGLCLNGLHASLPVGTLAANLIGGYLIGVLVALFQSYPHLSDIWRLFLITGLLGGLTTFSTFSAESMLLMQRGQYTWMLAHSAMHLLGAIGCCALGHASYRLLSA